MSFETVDFSEYNKPPFLPGWMNKEQTLQLAKTPDKQLEEFCVAVKTLSEQYSKDFFINNTELLNRRGRLLGIERQGSDNETYYKQQELRILLNLNNSSVPQIIKILKTFYSAEVIHIRPNYPAGITILHDGLSPVGVDFNSFIEETIGAGIAFETRELYVYKELMKLFDSKLTLKYWNLDEIHYCGQIPYNGIATYGGQHWEDMLYDGKNKYCGRDESDGLRRIRTEFFTLKENYVVTYIPKDEETGYLVLGDYNLSQKQKHYLTDLENVVDDEYYFKLKFGDIDYSGKVYYNGKMTYGTNQLEPRKMKIGEQDLFLKQKHIGNENMQIGNEMLKYKQSQATKDSAGLVDVVNLQHLYYSYFDGTENYDDSIMYGPEINTL